MRRFSVQGERFAQAKSFIAHVQSPQEHAHHPPPMPAQTEAQSKPTPAVMPQLPPHLPSNDATETGSLALLATLNFESTVRSTGYAHAPNFELPTGFMPSARPP